MMITKTEAYRGHTFRMSDMLSYLIGQSGIDIPESRTMEGGGRAVGASDRGKKRVLGQEHPSTLNQRTWRW
jgi:hypothetical protein